jgi:ATP-dependent Clp protease ATP-binding subunit ClpC
MNWFKEFWKRLKTPFAREIPFTPRATQALALARKEAERLRHDFAGPEHVLLGLIRLGQGVAVNMLTGLRVDLEVVRSQIEAGAPTGTREEAAGPIDFAPKVKRVLELADEERKALKHTYLGTEHLLLGLLRDGDDVAGNVFKGLGVNLETTRDQILKELEPYFKDDTEHPK